MPIRTTTISNAIAQIDKASSSGGKSFSLTTQSPTQQSLSSQSPTLQSVVNTQLNMQCIIAREFPNPQLATYLGDALAKALKRKKAQAEAQLSLVQAWGEVDDLIWSIGGGVAALLLGGGIASAVILPVWNFLAEKSTSQVDTWIAELQEAVSNASVSPEIINAIAIIGGDPTLLQKIKQEIGNMPRNSLNPYLNTLLAKEKSLKAIIKALPSFLFDNSPSLQIKVYSSLATIQYGIMATCDLLLGRSTPMPALDVKVSIAPSGSRVPNESTKDVSGDPNEEENTNEEENKSSIMPLLIALGIGATLLL